jgi:hypothetical protein
MKPIQEGTKGVITYYAKKHNKYVTRSFLWTNLCRVMENYITYFDTDMNGYRTATRPVKMSAKLIDERVQDEQQ